MYLATVVLAAVLGVAVIAMGTAYLLAPVTNAKGFGLPEWPEGALAAWLNIKGVRDLGMGVAILVLLATAGPHVMGWYLLVSALVPIGDAIVVLRHRGSKALAYGMHGATALVVIAVAAVLLLAG
ncbi:DUF4267 domain-containing protein [Kutzneria sp. 744]|uniref:DUF4267 domain-containing protein n=1 Tax=Kutzneria sp. (strain 744) TaxID=345341 RepID=UPI0003EEB13B|nr:DUF4267 domain-containing protein [Kutzneria sp. 744]EWM17001.1 small membrane hydrophobic protein [Kutzneria sp. 744]